GLIDEDSERETGIFQAAYDLRRNGVLHAYEEAALAALFQWFDEHLEKPDRFTAAKWPFHPKKNRAISWFKESSKDHVSRIREIALIVEKHGVAVNTIRTDRPGYVVYEDEHQIVAEPFSDTFQDVKE